MPTYKWNQLTAGQQQAARRIRDELAGQHGIGASVAQVAKYFDQAMAWNRGDLPLDEVTRIVGGVSIEPETNVAED